MPHQYNSTTLVGQYIGSNQYANARESGYTAIKVGVAYTGLMALLFFCVPNALLSLVTDDPNVIKLGRKILFLAAIFQVSENQTKSAELTKKYELGIENDLTKVMINQQMASLGFQMTLNVRNKVLSAYKDIMNMPV